MVIIQSSRGQSSLKLYLTILCSISVGSVPPPVLVINYLMIMSIESKTVSHTLTNNNTVSRIHRLFASLFVLAMIITASVSSLVEGTSTKVYAAETNSTVSTWWPIEGKTMQGVQPFKAIIEGKSVDEYLMYWQVDSGNWNSMDSNFEGYPHKEAIVDLTHWNWRANGAYIINFIAVDRNRNIIGEKNITIYTNVAVMAPVSPIISPIVPVSSVVSPITPALSPTPIQVVATVPNPILKTTVPTKFYVENNNSIKTEIAKNPSLAGLLSKIAENPQARWFGDWNSNIKNDVGVYVSGAELAGAIPILVAYNIPGRDCGNYSTGGASSADSYRQWISQMADGIGSRKAIVILEPDALALNNCLNENEKQVRYHLLEDAVVTLKSKNNITVYLDAGHPGWISNTDMASRLSLAGISSADGFSLNISNFETTDANISYGQSISKLVNGKHFVIDTSRNAKGANGEWCNPWGRGLGDRPTSVTRNSLVDAFLWIKVPGESDGTCNGGPLAGAWWLDYALDLSRNASF